MGAFGSAVGSGVKSDEWHPMVPTVLCTPGQCCSPPWPSRFSSYLSVTSAAICFMSFCPAPNPLPVDVLGVAWCEERTFFVLAFGLGGGGMGAGVSCFDAPLVGPPFLPDLPLPVDTSGIGGWNL